MGSLTFQAVAMGMRVHEMAGFDPEKAMGELEIPDEYEALTMVAIGYPAPADRLTGVLYEKETAPRSRKDLSEIVFHGRFGANAALSR
jgi:hypothetical protein